MLFLLICKRDNEKKSKERFFAVLLLLTIVFSNVGVDFFYVQASSIEANENAQEESTETVTDTVTVETGTETIADTEEVSESTETVQHLCFRFHQS